MNIKNVIVSCAVALGASTAFAEEDYPKTATDDAMDDGVDNVDVDVKEEADGSGTDVDINVDEDELKADAARTADKTASAANRAARAIQPRDGMFSGGMGSLKVLAGTGDFTQAGPRDITGIGPSWDVRGVFGAHSPIGLEAAYVGSARGIGGLGVDDQAALVSNGAETDLRIAAPIRAGENVDVRPFAFGGVGWQYMTLWGDGAVDGSRDEGDHILTIPAGVGLELGVGALNLDVRGTYRHAVDSEIFGDATAEFDDPNALHSYNVSAGLGFEF